MVMQMVKDAVRFIATSFFFLKTWLNQLTQSTQTIAMIEQKLYKLFDKVW